MEKNVLTSHVEHVNLKENTIQGLYSSYRACEKFWTLKVKVELSAFNEPKKRSVKT